MNNTADWRLRFFAIWTGQAFSILGSALVQFALIWWLTASTGSAVVLATVTLFSLLPHVLIGPFAGAWVDRHSRKRVMLLADGGIALATSLLLWQFATGQVQIWQVYLLMMIRSLGGVFHMSAMQASTSLMVPEAWLSRVAGLNQALQGVSSIAAPPLGALLVSLLPMQSILAIDIGTAVLAMLPLAMLGVPEPVRKPDSTPATPRQLLLDVREGFQFVLSWRALTIVIGLAMLINFILTPANALTPIMVLKHFQGGAAELAALEAAMGVGIIAGGVLLGVWGGFKRRIVTSLLGLAGIGAGVIVTGLAPAQALPMAVFGFAVSGVCMPLTNGSMGAIIQASVPPEMQGRVFSLIVSLTTAISPISLLIAGPVADAIGVQTWYVFGGVMCVLAAGMMLLSRSVMRIEAEGRERRAPTAFSANEATKTVSHTVGI
jgi:MFS transporter, DHA3 family, macrolide efflux protein